MDRKSQAQAGILAALLGAAAGLTACGSQQATGEASSTELDATAPGKVDQWNDAAIDPATDIDKVAPTAWMPADSMAAGFAAGEPLAIGNAMATAVHRDLRWSVQKFMAAHPATELQLSTILTAYPLWYDINLPDGSPCEIREGDPDAPSQLPGIQGQLSLQGWNASVYLPAMDGPVFSLRGAPFTPGDEPAASDSESALFATLGQIQSFARWSGRLPESSTELFEKQHVRPGKRLQILPDATSTLSTPGFLIEFNPTALQLRITELTEEGDRISRWHQYRLAEGRLQVEPEFLPPGDARLNAPGYSPFLAASVLP